MIIMHDSYATSGIIDLKDIKLNDINLDAQGITKLDKLIAYGHNHTSDQIVFSKLSWTNKYILSDLINELHKENLNLKTSLETQSKDIKQLQNQNGNIVMTLED